jgi:hypothetical protein
VAQVVYHLHLLMQSFGLLADGGAGHAAEHADAPARCAQPELAPLMRGAWLVSAPLTIVDASNFHAVSV